MPQFLYKARNRRSEVIENAIDAPDRAQVVSYLIQRNLTPITITEAPTDKATIPLFRGFQKPHMKKAELIVFTRQLASILKTGISLLDTIEILESQTSPRASLILKALQDNIQQGTSFSDALAKHPKVFDDIYVNMVRVGEAGGILTEVLERMASMLEYAQENKQRIKSALRYPKIVLIVMLMAFVAIIMLIIPKFSSVFSSLGANLPLPTQILVTSYDIIAGYWFIVLPLVVIGIFAFNRWRNGVGRLIFDAFWLKFPVFGQLTLKSDLAVFARFFASLYKSGVPITDVLEMSSKIVENQVLANLIDRMRTSAISGQPLVAPLKETKVFPELAIQVISVGEKTGAITDMFERLSAYYENEVDHTIKNISTLIEPFLIVGLGGMVLLIALGVFLPMWKIMEVFKASSGT